MRAALRSCGARRSHNATFIPARAKVRAHPVTIARFGFSLQYLSVSLLGAIGRLFLRLIPFFNVVS
jgi:hypothetical protein